MAGSVRILFLLMFGLALAVGYNAWSGSGDAGFDAAGGEPVGVDVMSYVSGLVVGMLLWQIGSVKWDQLPTRIHHYLASQMHFYQFMAMGAACLLVLVYF